MAAIRAEQVNKADLSLASAQWSEVVNFLHDRHGKPDPATFDDTDFDFGGDSE